MGFTHAEVAQLVPRSPVREEVSALELNVSCPNVETGTLIGSDPAEVAALLDVVRPLTDKPLIVKLTPNAADVPAVARAAQDAGADAVSLINTLRGMALRPGNRASRGSAAVTGGVSGAAVRAVALAQTAAVCAQIAIPVVAMGGVQTGRDAADLLAVGATLVAVGTESFRDPLAGARIAAELDALALPGPARPSEPPCARRRRPSAEPIRPPVVSPHG